MPTVKSFLRFLISLALCYGAGAVGSVYTMPAIGEWYQYLNKPEFSPPNWIFGPVWTTLYTMMAIALFLVWQRGWKDQMEVELSNKFYVPNS